MNVARKKKSLLSVNRLSTYLLEAPVERSQVYISYTRTLCTTDHWGISARWENRSCISVFQALKTLWEHQNMCKVWLAIWTRQQLVAEAERTVRNTLQLEPATGKCLSSNPNVTDQPTNDIWSQQRKWAADTTEVSLLDLKKARPTNIEMPPSKQSSWWMCVCLVIHLFSLSAYLSNLAAVFKGKLHSEIIISDLVGFFFFRRVL